MSSLIPSGPGVVASLAIAVTMAITASVHAVPNPRCAGTCADGLTGCGAASDCGADGTCSFPDACLPGLAGLITAVLPETPGGIDDPNAWSCGSLRCRVAGDMFVFGSDLGIDVVAAKDLVLEPGRRYLVRGEMRADADTWGYLDVVGGDVAARSQDVVGVAQSEDEWQSIGAMFELPMGAAPETLQVRLHADGPGELAVRGLVVYVIADYGVWLRMTLVAPERAATFRLAHVLRHADAPPGRRPTVCADGAPVTSACIDPRLARAEVAAGGSTPWLEVSAMFAGGTRATHAWEVVDAAGALVDEDATVRVEVAWGPDAAAIVWSSERAGAGRFGLVLPDGVPAVDTMLDHLGWLRDVVADDRAVMTRVADRPETMTVGVLVKSIDDFERWSTIANDAVALQADLGLNAPAFLTAAPRAADHAAADELGLTRRIVSGDVLVAGVNDLDREAIAAQVRATVGTAAWRDQLGEAGADDVVVVFGSGGAGLRLAGPAHRAAFHAWLAAGASADGLEPADFGVSAFDEVMPLEDMTADEVLAARPDPSDSGAAHRFVWALRFWSVATARVYAAVLDALQAETGVRWRAALDGGSFDDGGFGFGLGTELQTALGERAASGFIGRSGGDDCRAWELAYQGDWVAGAVEPWDAGGRTVGAWLDASRGDQGRKMLELAGRGFDVFVHDAYGPHDLDTGDRGGGGLGAGSRAWLERVAGGSTMLAAVEPALVGARQEASPIVMLGSRTDAVWTDLGAATEDELGWHMAFMQAHFPIDVMPESEIEAGRLEGPDAPKRLLFVLRKHVSRAAFRAIIRWVEDGGTLVVGPDLASHDEHGQLDIERATWLAVAPGSTLDLSARTIEWVTRDGVTSFAFTGVATELLGVGATTLARLDDERPVVVRMPRGRGRVVALGLDIGEAYRRPTRGCEPRPAALAPAYPEHFSQAMRGAMTSLASALGLDQIRRVTADDPRVSLQSVEGPSGPAVVAVAWSSGPVDVALNTAAWRGCDSVRELVEGYDVPVIFGSVLMRIDRAAVLTWDPDDCTPPAVVEPVADLGAEVVEPRPASRDVGCTGGGVAWLGLAFIVVWRRRTS